MGYPQHKSEESTQDYLETILQLSKERGNVRSIDIVHEMNYTKPSVSVAMKNLKEKQLIEISTEGYITLTKEGLKIAEDVSERHEILSAWLIHLGVSEEVAKADACKMEHDMSAESFAAIKRCVLDLMKKA